MWEDAQKGDDLTRLSTASDVRRGLEGLKRIDLRVFNQLRTPSKVRRRRVVADREALTRNSFERVPPSRQTGILGRNSAITQLRTSMPNKTVLDLNEEAEYHIDDTGFHGYTEIIIPIKEHPL